MRRFDVAAAIGGLFFMSLALYFLARNGHGSANDLGVIFPLLLVVLGLGVIMNNRNSP